MNVASPPDLQGFYLAVASEWGKRGLWLQWRRGWTLLTDRPKYGFLLLLIKEVQQKGGGTWRTDAPQISRNLVTFHKM